ncbi:MAG: DUF3298 and DUF4163 domain-containing protein [Candidatus Symbiothrix sp.]|jgi:hypothetical protein|nr:DUF3298 and DUF4163 domain-containing protein [Candidatus Symbiothrix sp.]
MKNICYKTIVLFVTAYFLLSVFSCKQSVKSTEIVFDTIRVDRNHFLANDTSGKLKCHLNISFVYPKSFADTLRQKQIQSVFIEKMLSKQFSHLSPEQAVEAYVQQYIKDFDASFSLENFDPEDYGLADEKIFSYEQHLENEIVFRKDNFISFIVESDAYEGGAHGSHHISAYVLDTLTGELLTQEDFAGLNYQKNVADVIIRKIAEANGVETVEELENTGYINIKELEPNGNFTIDDKGITYYFNEYEIAAFFIGVTKVFIPYREFSVYLIQDSPLSSLAGSQ